MGDDNVKSAVAAVIDAASAQRVEGYSDEFRDALNGLAELPVADRGRLRDLLIQGFPTITAPIGAGLLAVWFGSGVENGAEPEPTAGVILQTMLNQTRKIVTVPEASDEEDPPADEEVLSGIQFLGQALVAHVGRSAVLRERISRNAQIVGELERVAHLAVGATWVSELLRQKSGDVLVFHADHPQGVQVRYANLSNCFHFFTLLQASLESVMPDAQQANANVVAVARGEAFEDVNDSAWWHFGQGTSSKATLESSVWGEGALTEIATIDGQQVVILWPPILQGRGWSGGFFGPYLQASPPSVTVTRRLPPEEVTAWREKLSL